MADLNLYTVRGGLKIVSENSSFVINEYSTKINDLSNDEISIISDIKDNYAELDIKFSNYDSVLLNGDAVANALALETLLEFNTQTIDVFIQDQSTPLIDLHLTKEVQSLTLISTVTVDTNTVTVSSGVQPTVGNMTTFKEGTYFYQAEILTSVANGLNWDITLDSPFDYAFTASSVISEGIWNLNVNGSVTHQHFKVGPGGLQSGVQWDITRIILVITDDLAMDDGKFGGLTALTKGIVFRSSNGIYKNIFNAKTNGDLAAHTFDTVYIDATLGPGGQNSLRARSTFAGQDKRGVVVRLSSDESDTLDCIIQDDLTALTKFQIIAQGHVVE